MVAQNKDIRGQYNKTFTGVIHKTSVAAVFRLQQGPHL